MAVAADGRRAARQMGHAHVVLLAAEHAADDSTGDLPITIGLPGTLLDAALFTGPHVHDLHGVERRRPGRRYDGGRCNTGVQG